MNINRQRQLSEMWNSEVQEINDAVVSSGETRNYERMRNEWIKMVEKLGEPFSIDDLTEIKFAQRKPCKELDRKCVFKEMTEYLYKKKYITEQESKQLNDDVKIMPNDIQFKFNRSRALFAKVVENVRQEFSDNKLPEEFQDEEYIKGLFYRLNERKLLESMSFGLNMTVADVNFFLKKVFQNKELDNDIPDEFLLSVVLQNKPAENISRYQQFIALKKYYAVMESGAVEKDLDENADVQEMQLFEGEQCTDETISRNLRRILRKYDKRHMRINQVVKKFKDKDIATYKYVICYLLDKIDFTDIEIDLEVLFQDIEQNRIGNTDARSENDLNQEDFPNSSALDSKEAFQKLIQRVQERFKEHELPDEFCKESYIEELILNLDEKKLLESMAFGLDMTVETVNLFLAKVLKRSELDYYDPKEYLLAIILNNSKYDDRLKYPQYISLKKYYEAMKVDLKKSVIEPENTRSILDEADISFAEKTELFKGAECTNESIHLKLKEMLARHHLMRKKLRQAKDGRTFEFRTADREFFDLMEKVQRRYSGKISIYKGIQDEMEDSALLEQRKSAAGILKIQCEPDREIKLKRGCRFYGLSQKDPANPIYFILDQDVTLPACKSVKLILPVRSITEKPEKAEQKKFVEKNKFFQAKNHIESIISAKSGEKDRPRYYKADAEESDNGTIKLECKPGTVIAKGTRFTYTENDNVYEFESIKNTTANIIYDITVCCKLFDKHGKPVDDWVRTTEQFMKIGKRKTTNTKNKSTVYYTLAETNTVCHVEPMVDGVIKIWNPKPINYEQENAAVINYQTDKFLPFYRYMYGAYKTDYFDQIFDEIDGSLFGGWFTSTEITYNTMNEEQFSKKKSSKKRNDILTLIFLIYVRECELNNELPQDYNFRRQVNKTMQRCRLQTLYLGNPYDCLLTYLLAYDSPVDVLREIWAVVKNTKGKKQREA